MNAYLQRKCRSEQQLMNELTKLVAARDVASKRMSELAKELAFFYVAPVLPRIPHSVLKDLCALLAGLKDKKEELRIARMALCFLARIVDQFELRYQERQQQQQQLPSERTQSFELSVSVLATLMRVMEKAELSHASLPRQHTCLKLFAHLCRIFDKSDVLLLRVKPLLLKSPAWTLLSGDKKAIAAATGKKDFLAQLAHLGAMLHAVRFHLSPGEQETMLEQLFQAAFLPASVPARHAAATVLALFELSSAHAKTVVKALEWYLMKFRPTSLRVGDTLAAIYLLHLAGQISRLPAVDDSGVSATAASTRGVSVSNLLDLADDTSAPGSATTAPSPPPSPVARQRQRLEGVTVSASLAARLKDMLLDTLCAAAEQKPSATAASPWVPSAVVVVAVEETVKDSSAESCYLKVRGSVCVFEIVAGVLLRLLRDALAAGSVVALHRLCRVVQFAAESLDGAVLQMTGPAHQPQFLDKVTERVGELSVSHPNPFVACESLRALVWLLPRAESAAASGGWDALLARLVALPVDQIRPESRAAIADAFFHRAVTSPSLNQHAIDSGMLGKGLRVTLVWYEASPCEWHAAMLVRIWHTALRKALPTLGDAVFRAVCAVLDFQHPQLQRRGATELASRSALDFLARVGAGFAVRHSRWVRALLLRLTKQLLLAPLVARRLSVRVLQQLALEAQRIENADTAQQITALLAYVSRSDPSDDQQHGPLGGLGRMPPVAKPPPDVFVQTRIHSMAVKDTLQIQDLLTREAPSDSRDAVPTASASIAAAPPMAFDGVF
ncbi:hypothetical protein PybrP1_012600 [[Pythium] brassicae (nom. inval.)]|nr:hypothetical protein PybrP1_012600 [[Pythium] brassicae (nom. inval.)]